MSGRPDRLTWLGHATAVIDLDGVRLVTDPAVTTRMGHLLRTDGFPHVADIMVNSFYDPELDEGCAFEELISFHGGMGGGQTRPFILHPVSLPLPAEPIVGAAAVHGVLSGWREALQNGGEALDATPVAVSARE